MKLGKLPFVKDNRDFQFAKYRDKSIGLPSHPNVFGYGKLIQEDSWGMLGNDVAGDCVWASAAHQSMLWCAATAKAVPLFTPECVLSDYTAVTGYNPMTGANDNGTQIRDALKYRQTTGILDGDGERHKIAAYVSIPPKNLTQMVEALYLFGIVEIGIRFPAYAMSLFNQGLPWTDKKGAKIEGGHDIPLVARPNMLYSSLVTWGKMIPASNNFLLDFVDEAWAIISPEFFTGEVITPEGFNLQQLQADLAAL